MLAVAMQAATGLALEVGHPAPALVAQEFDGHPFDLTAERGKVVIIHFWATWCPSCRTEMPVLEGLYHRDHSQGLDLIGLSLDRPHDKGEAIKTMAAFSFPAAMLDDAATNGFGKPGTLPLTLIIDRAGVVRVAHTPDQPPLTESSLAAEITPLLADQAPSKG
jgi:peroxiredoxin